MTEVRDPLAAVVAEMILAHEVISSMTGWTRCRCGLEFADSTEWSQHSAQRVVAAQRPHIDAEKQAAAAQVLQDAADRIDEHPNVCLSGYRVSNEHDMDSDCSHCIAFDLRAAAGGDQTPIDPAGDT